MSIELCSVWFEMNVMLWQRKLMQLSRRILHASGTLPPPASLSALKDECPQHFIGWDKCFFLARKVWSLLSLPSSLSLWDQSFTLGSLQWAQAFFPSYGHPSRNSTTPGDKSMSFSCVSVARTPVPRVKQLCTPCMSMLWMVRGMLPRRLCWQSPIRALGLSERATEDALAQIYLHYRPKQWEKCR